MSDEDLLLQDPSLEFGSGVIGVCDICGKRQAVITLQKERYKLCVLDFLNKSWIGSKSTPGRPLPAFRSDRVWFDSPAVAGGHAQGILLTPTKETRHPGVLVTSDVYGLTTMVLDAALRFAHAGYEVLLPDLGKTDLLGPGDLLSLRADVRLRGGVRVESPRIRKVVELYDDALEYLRTRPMVDPGRTAVFGASYGGSLALAVAGEDRNLAGVALAFPQPIAPGDYARLLNAPVLVVAGDRDASAQRCRDQLEAARANGLDLRVEMIPGPGHLFLARESRAYDLSSAEAAWAKILRFLQERLVPPPPKPPVPPVARTVPTPGAAPAAPAPGAPSAVRAVPPVPEPPSPPPLRPA